MSGNTSLASAINLVDIAAHPAEAFAALLEVVQHQGDLIKALQARQDSDYEHFSGDILDHGQLLKKLEVVELLPAQIDRAQVLKALLAANGGKILAKDARKKMRVDKSTFSRLLSKMKNEIEIRTFRTDKRNYLLVLKSENG